MMKRFALICMMVVVAAAATWAASTTEKAVSLKTLQSSASFQDLLNDLRQQAAAKSTQGSPRTTWQTLLRTAPLNKTTQSGSRTAADLSNANTKGAASRISARPQQTPQMAADLSNVRSGGAASRALAQAPRAPRLAGNVSNVSGGGAAPHVLTLQNQIDALEGQIDQALARHEDPSNLYISLNALYAQRPSEKDKPAVPSGGEAGNSVPVICGGDTCASATPITALPFCAQCFTTNAHDDYQPTCITGPSGPDVVFKYTPTENQVVSFSLCGSAFNTVLSIYDGCPVAGVAPLCCSDDGCGPNNQQSCCPGVELLAGHTYYIIVDGATPQAFGQFRIHVTLGEVCASAPCFSDNRCPYPNREVDANDGCGEPDLPTLACTDTVCGEIRPNGDRDWYQIVIPENTCRVLKIDVFGNDTPGFFPFGRGLDPLVALYAGDCTTLIGSDDNGGVGYDSRLITECLPAGVYFIRVVGVEGSTGPYALAITCRNCDCPLPPCVECPTNAVPEDEGCTPNSASINGGCNDSPPQFGQIQCGELLCGTMWEAQGGNSRDTDWYRFVLEERDSVRFTVKANMPFSTYIVQLTGAINPCDTILTPFGADGDTCEVVTVAACLAPGTYYFFVAPQFFIGNYSCARYVVRMECLPCAEAPSCVRCPENSVAEDEACVAFSPSANGGCNDQPPLYGEVHCGELLCGTFWEGYNAAGANIRDTDWYRFELQERDSVRFAVLADRPFVTYIVQLTGGAVPCDTILTPYGAEGDSCHITFVSACLPPGVYYFFVAPQFGLSGFDCGRYLARMECLPCSEPPSCIRCPENAVPEDEGCTPNAASINGGCNDVPPQFGQVHCGELLCGTFWETQDGGYRDTDWYQFVLAERDSVRFTAKADKPFVAYIVQPAGAASPCDGIFVPYFAEGDSCEVVTVAACLAPGTYYFFVAPQFSVPNFDCGRYIAHMECLPCTEHQTCIICPETARQEDEPCPNVPDTYNGGCDAREPNFSRISCNDAVCGTAFAGIDAAGNRLIDEDWYQLVLEHEDSVRFCMRADFRAAFAIFWAGFNPPCDTTRLLLAYGLADSCGEGSCISACLPAGVYYLAVAPTQATDCGHYVIRTQCLPCENGCIVCPENIPHEDEACLSYPDVTNGGCFTRGDNLPHYARIACNSAICGTSWYLPPQRDNSSSLFDTDWYLFNLDERDSVTFVLRSDFPAILGIGYFRNGVVNCDSLTILGAVPVGPCQTFAAGDCLPPGKYVLIVLPDYTNSSLPPILCGNYVLGVFCQPCAGPCVECPPNAAIEDEGCSPTAPNINGGCDSPPGTALLFGQINCGQTICGTSWESVGPNGNYLRDTDWFQFPVTQGRDSIVFTYKADFATAARIVRLGAAAPCPAEEVWSGVLDSCEQTLFGLCLTPGVYSVVITPALGHVFDCGHYVLNMQCTECLPCPQEWAVDGYDLGDLGPCYPTLPMNPAHGISGIAWLGQTITTETNPVIGDDDAPTGGDDGVHYLHLPWTPCAMETVIVTVTGGPNYPRYAACEGQLYLNGWKDGNHNGNFCDTLWCGGAAARILADEWIVQDKPVTPGVYTIPVLDPGVLNIGIYDGVFRWRLTSHPVGRYGFGQATTQCDNQCGNFAVDFLGEVEDYILHDAQLDVSLTSFEAVPGDNQVTLRWVTASETGNDHFSIMRNGSELTRVATQGNGADRHVYSYTDDRAANGTRYSYTLMAIDQTGGGTVLQTVSAEPTLSAATITDYALHQNYPNPFNPTTNITFDLLDGGFVSVKVYNLVGQEVATVVNGTLAKGQHTVSFDASKLPTGIYVYRLEVNGFSAVRKMLLTK
jgi:hypothetical protein